MAADIEPNPEKPAEDILDEVTEESSDASSPIDPVSIPVEADAADVVEQHREVPIDDEYER